MNFEMLLQKRHPDGIVEVEGITTVEGGMNWLHRGGYIESESRLEHFYREVIRNFHSQIVRDDKYMEFMIFSRPLSTSRNDSMTGTTRPEGVPAAMPIWTKFFVYPEPPIIPI